MWMKPTWLPWVATTLAAHAREVWGHAQRKFLDALRRVFLHSGAILGSYVAEGRILVSLLYCAITTVAQMLTWVNPCPLNLELQRSFPYCYIHTNTEREREREGLRERKN